jgi:hypothetical protein
MIANRKRRPNSQSVHSKPAARMRGSHQVSSDENLILDMLTLLALGESE